MKNLKAFIINTLNLGEFEGCRYAAFDDDGLFLVFAWNKEYGLEGKIACNCDDLQCDYDYDWEYPLDEDKECIIIELSGCNKMSPEAIWHYFKTNYTLAHKIYVEAQRVLGDK